MGNLGATLRNHLSMRAVYGILLVLVFGIALAIRVFPAYESVFAGDWVRFGGNDPWYHMRLVENLVQHFPHRISFDPFTFYPYGQDVFFAPFFDLLLGFTVWVLGLGSPSQQTIATVGAYFPAVLGALATIPVYFVGKELFNRTAGLLSAGLIAVLPGEFLTRSVVGFTDHHAVEILFSTMAFLFLILAIKGAKARETSFGHIWRRQWGSVTKPLVYGLLAGVFLGLYLVSWAGGPFIMLIVFGSVVCLYMLDHLRGKSTDYLCVIGLPMCAIAFAIVAVFLGQLPFGGFAVASLSITALSFPVLSGVSRLMESRNIRRAFYPLASAVLGSLGLGVFYIVDPGLLGAILEKFGIFVPDPSASTVHESLPLFPSQDGSLLSPVWDRFTTGTLIAPVSLVLIAYAAIRKASAEKVLFLVWTVVMLAAMIGQVRFTYYFAVNVALLSGYLCWRIPGWLRQVLDRFGLREAATRGEARRVESRRKQKRELRARGTGAKSGFVARYLASKRVSGALAALVIFFLAFYPNIGAAIDQASGVPGPSDDWRSALVWMKENTPDPFQNPDFYYGLYERPETAAGYEYPQSAYGVMSWWDYGHWITGIAHRIPNCNPHQRGAGSAARFLTAQDESSANTILDGLGTRYVIIDISMARPFITYDGKIATDKLLGIARWAGKSVSDFLEVYYLRAEGGLRPIPLLYPEYYRSMCSRLYNFGGREVIPRDSTWVISYAERDGYKEITSSQTFPTYDDAMNYLGNQTSGRYRIVGTDPYVSPVPLEKLQHYELVHHSDSWSARPKDGSTVYTVEVFEYTP